MERVIVTNYQEVKDELVDYIIAVRRNCYNRHNYLTLAVDPDKGKMDINIRFDNSYYYPFEVEISSFHEIYAGCCEDAEEKAIDLLDAAMTTIAVEYGIEIELKPNEPTVIAIDKNSIYPDIFVKHYFGGDPS